MSEKRFQYSEDLMPRFSASFGYFPLPHSQKATAHTYVPLPHLYISSTAKKHTQKLRIGKKTFGSHQNRQAYISVVCMIYSERKNLGNPSLELCNGGTMHMI